MQSNWCFNVKPQSWVDYSFASRVYPTTDSEGSIEELGNKVQQPVNMLERLGRTTGKIVSTGISALCYIIGFL